MATDGAGYDDSEGESAVPHQFDEVEKLPGDQHETDAYLPLYRLRENDYNPRRRDADTNADALRKSIEQGGLINPLLVRPLDDEESEVIAGTRRLKSLREIYGEDSPILIPCRVRDVDDHEARVLALEENIAREPLTPLEAAHGFAEAIVVEYGENDGEQRFAEYLPDANAVHGQITIPSQDHPQVQALAERIQLSAMTIRRRLRLLVLPEEVQLQIEQGVVPLRVAETIAEQLVAIPDPDRRHEQMTEFVSDPNYVETSSPDLDALEAELKRVISAYERQQYDPEERLEDLKQEKQQRERELRAIVGQTVEWYSERNITDKELSTDQGEDFEVSAKTVLRAFQDRYDELDGERLATLDDRLKTIRRDRNHTERVLEIIREEARPDCPSCGTEILASDLNDRIYSLEDQVEGLEQRKHDIKELRDEFRERRHDLRTALQKYTQAVADLTEEQERASS